MGTLLKIGAYEQAPPNVRNFFGAMEPKTGPLWESREGTGSRDHGFASYARPAVAKAVENRNKEDARHWTVKAK